MKIKALSYILFYLLIALFKVNTQDYDSNHIFYIIDGCVNGTILSIVDLKNYDGKYIYFQYEFKQCLYTKQKKIAYFDLNGASDLINKTHPLNYQLVEKYITGVNEINNSNWKEIQYLSGNEEYYSYSVERSDKNANAVLFRIPTNGKKEGIVDFENTGGIDEDENSEDKNNTYSILALTFITIALIILLIFFL